MMTTPLAKTRYVLAGAWDFFSRRSLGELLTKAYRLLRREGLEGIKRVVKGFADISYSEWIRRYDTLSDGDRLAIVQHIGTLTHRPLVSVLMPVFNPPAEYLEQAIASVRRQLYPEWELCIADDASSAPHVRPILERAARDDSRIRVVFRPKNGHISAASNTALGIARGEFVALLDHDDELAEHALYHVAIARDEDPAVDLLYSDEDKIDARGRRFGHYFKPDWNPDLFLAQNLISHLGVYRRAIAEAIGGFRPGYEGAQDWDFALRFVERVSPQRIRHIPHVLYHWRAIAGSTAETIAAKSYAVEAVRRTLENHWRRRGMAAIAEHVASGHFVTRVPLPVPPPRVSVIVPTRNRVDLLRKCISGLHERTRYRDIELLIVDNDSDEPAALSYLDDVQRDGFACVLRYPATSSPAAICNWAVERSRGEVICLLSDDVEAISPSWLEDMVAHASRSEIGAVGAMLCYPDGTIQHAGMVLDGLIAFYPHRHYSRGALGYGSRARLPQNFAGVSSACLVVRRAIWNEVGGMDETLAVPSSEIDFCLRVREHGYRNLWLPQAELRSHESLSHVPEDSLEDQHRFNSDAVRLRKRWGDLPSHDPAWNPNLALDGAHIRPADPPRVVEPWKSRSA